MSLAPYVQTDHEIVDEMLKIAEVKKGELIYDLGCGDGRILIAAALDYNARGVGIEIRKDLVEVASSAVKDLGLEDRVKIIHGSILNPRINFREADVVTIYLTNYGNERIRPKLESQLKSSCRVISHLFPIVDWKPEIYKASNHILFLYRMSEIYPKHAEKKVLKI